MSATKELTSEQIMAIGRALAEPRRFAILQQIARQSTFACGALAEHSCLSPATISHHLKELAEVGLIEGEREGRTVRFRLQRAVWDAYLRALGSL